ncbi:MULTISPECIES: phage tail tape measure protein [unclassified Pseudomonas]|uniref:Putative tail tape measure protein n=1 Tax=viral metagenome TaxID=1070528 RepID=A0A6M3M1F5_9ZZZZ|nr:MULTISPECIES: phage tail tape measure protein [unclassified Pseudomonas]MBU0523504.1 phage tail tape measure protein [Gammaproteobacteria bacterium]MBU0819934.1 phage tail tape measure protein [Gammaproteobacteria bacterium]MBU0842057.1 phage tail tape measure protein [Gammaproteobacteria bacterium]MBU1842884.1 phage tail tape measure protein [Gammaproteobacteria bacterium]PMV86008.1 phage tail tape measure protein [Pseudomonas sp. GW101-1A09]
MAGKSLGTLTLDLVAKIGAFTGPLDKASQEAKKRNAEIAKSFDNLAKGVGVAIGSIPAVLTALVVHSASVAKEISNQAALAGLGTTEFQKYAAAAKTVGVEQDKLSDIFKDTNDKMGDFASTGGGELKDFFENIAPKVGLTAESFKKLNSKDALALYVTSLEKANVSQQEMTFYMEAIANDSTALVPLLRNGGKAFDELGKAALDAGIVMDETTIAAAKQFGIELQGLGQYITSAQTMLAAEFLPVLAQFSKDINQSAKDAGGLSGVVGDLGEKLVTTTAFFVNAGDGVVRVFDIVANTLVGMFATAVGHTNNLVAQANSALGTLSFGETSKEFKATAAEYANDARIQFSIAAQAADSINESLTQPLAGDKFKEYVANAKKAASEISSTTLSVTPGKGSGVDPKAIERAKKAAQDAATAAKKISDTFKSTETDLERQIALINTSTDAQKKATEIDKIRFEVASGKLVGINAIQQQRLEGLAAELDALQKIKLANEDAAKLTTFGDTLKDSNQTVKQSFELELAGAGSGDKLKERLQADLAIQQDYNEQAADLQKQLNGGDITQELYEKETEMLGEALAERMILQQDYYNQQDEAQNNWLDGVSSAWESYRDTAIDYQQQAADATSSFLEGTSSAISDNLQAMVLENQSFGDSVANVAASMAKSIIAALADMAAQWLVYQAVQLIVGKTTQASAATTLAANATAMSLQAGLAAFASTAAIPIVGPFAAPGAMAAALAITGPLAGAVGAAALAGMAHDGIDAVPETGTWLLQKGERVTTAETSSKLDKTLNDVQNRQASGGGVVVNLHEDASKAGQVQTSTNNGQTSVDAWVSNIMNDGEVHEVMAQKYGLSTVGS